MHAPHSPPPVLAADAARYARPRNDTPGGLWHPTCAMVCFRISLREVPASVPSWSQDDPRLMVLREKKPGSYSEQHRRVDWNLHWRMMPSGTERSAAVPVASWSAPEVQRTPNGSQRSTAMDAFFLRAPYEKQSTRGRIAWDPNRDRGVAECHLITTSLLYSKEGVARILSQGEDTSRLHNASPKSHSACIHRSLAGVGCGSAVGPP